MQLFSFALVAVPLVGAQGKIKCDTKEWNDLSQMRADQAAKMMNCNADATSLADLINLNASSIRTCFCTPAILDGLTKYVSIYLNRTIRDVINMP